LISRNVSIDIWPTEHVMLCDYRCCKRYPREAKPANSIQIRSSLPINHLCIRLHKAEALKVKTAS